MRIAINNIPSEHGYYDKAQGLLDAAEKKELDYHRYKDGEEYDVVINLEPIGFMGKGKKLTVLWTWDTNRTSLHKVWDNQHFDLLFRAHATFYHSQGVDPRGRRVYWMPPAVDPVAFRRDESIKQEFDVVFAGRDRMCRHAALQLEILRKHFTVNHVTQKLPYKEYVKEMCRGKYVLNAPDHMETNKRVFEALSIGPALMPWGPDYSLLLQPFVHYVPTPTFFGYGVEETSIVKEAELNEKRLKLRLELYLKEGLRHHIAKGGRDLIKSKFTFEKQVDRIEHILKLHI